MNNKLWKTVDYANGKKEWYLNGQKLTQKEFEEQMNKPEIDSHSMNKPEIDSYGNKHWKNDKGHSHREDGPAIEHANGTKYWYLNGHLHREDGPAVIYGNGSKFWYLNGQLHREDGPAVECTDGSKSWYLNGQSLTQKEFEEQMNKPEIDSQAHLRNGAGHLDTSVLFH